jgi:hypothetical protein
MIFVYFSFFKFVFVFSIKYNIFFLSPLLLKYFDGQYVLYGTLFAEKDKIHRSQCKCRHLKKIDLYRDCVAGVYHSL